GSWPSSRISSSLALGRRSGFFSRQRCTMGSSSSGTPSRDGGALITRCTTACTLSAPNGALPVEANAVTQPQATTSTLSVIAVHDAGLVDGHQRGRGVDRQPLQRRPAVRAAPGHRLLQGGAVHVLADHVGRVDVEVGRVDGRGAEGRDLLRRAHLLLEALAQLVVLRPLVVEDLDRDLFALGVACQVDDTLAALAEAAHDAVVTERGGVARRQRFGTGHGTPPGGGVGASPRCALLPRVLLHKPRLST